MLITLFRHGMAASTAEAGVTTDAERPLTAAGAHQVQRVVEGLVRAGWVPRAIVCSPLRRAAQTARIISTVVGLPVRERGEVLRADHTLLEALARLGVNDPVVVGHMPGLAVLAGDLVGARSAIELTTAGVVVLEVEGLPPTQPARLRLLLPSSVGERLT